LMAILIAVRLLTHRAPGENVLPKIYDH